MQDRLFIDGCTVSIETPAQANSFLLALQAALKAAARPTSYSTLAGITGVAFQSVPWEYNEQKEWEELAVRIPFVGDALGVQWNVVGSDSNTSDIEPHCRTQEGSQTTLLCTQTTPRIAGTIWDDQAVEEIRLLFAPRHAHHGFWRLARSLCSSMGSDRRLAKRHILWFPYPQQRFGTACTTASRSPLLRQSKTAALFGR